MPSLGSSHTTKSANPLRVKEDTIVFKHASEACGALIQQHPQPAELHISSIIVWAKCGAAQQVAEHLAAWPDVHVHGGTPDDKLILTLETEDFAALSARIDAIREVAQVLAANLVYHHVESVDALAEEMSS
jgi:nitrate reductase NapD